jgi:hypothetical protein
MKKSYVPVFIIIGLAFLALAVYYWVTPAGSLPGFLPGHEAGSSHHHTKHGLAALILAIGSGILAWFASGEKSTSPKNRETE